MMLKLKGIYLLIFLFILFMPLVSSNELTVLLGQEEYHPGETLQAMIYSNIYLENNLAQADFSLWFNNSKIPISPTFYKLNNTQHYIYFNLDSDLELGNYTIFIDNLVYFENSILTHNNHTELFNITSSDVPFYVSPGIVILDTSNPGQTFLFSLRNSGLGELDIFVSSSDDNIFDLSLSTIQIGPGEIEPLSLYSNNILLDTSLEQYITFESNSLIYEVPVWFNVNSEDDEVLEDVDLSDEGLVFVMPSNQINLEIYPTENVTGYVEIQNNYDHSVSTVSFKLDGNIEEIIILETETIYSVQPGEKIKMYLYVNSEMNAESGIYEGNISISTEYMQSSFPIIIEVKETSSDCFIEGCSEGYFCNETTNSCDINSETGSCIDIGCPTGWMCNSTSGDCDSEVIESEINKGLISLLIIILSICIK